MEINFREFLSEWIGSTFPAEFKKLTLKKIVFLKKLVLRNQE